MRIALVLAAVALAPAALAQGGGLVSADDLHTEPYVDFPRSPLDNAFRGQTPAIGGLSNDVDVLLGNPLSTEASLQMGVQVRSEQPQQQGPGQPYQEPPWNVTTLVLPPHAKIARTLHVVPPASTRGVQVVVRLHGTSSAWSGDVEQSTQRSVLPPVRVELVSPAPVDGLATVGSLEGGGGGGGLEGVPLAFAPTTRPVAFKARVTNDGDEDASFMLRIASDQGGGAAGQLVQVSGLRAGESREIDLGSVEPAKLDPDVAKSRGVREFGFYVSFLHADDKPDAFGPTAASWTTVGSAVGALKPAAVAVGFRHEFAVDALAPASAKLGETVTVRAVAEQFGTTDEKSNEIVVTLDPPFNAEYEVQGAQRATYVETVPAGASHARAIPFTPLVAGRWSIVVQWDANGPGDKATSVFTIDVPTDVDVSVLGTDGARALALGGAATAPVHVTALRPLHGAVLRLTTGAALSTQGGGDRGPQVAVSGLSASVVRASPAETPLGDLTEGESRWTNVTVTSTGTGDFNVVPYVVAGGYAYTGIPEATSQNGGPRVAAANGPVFEVLVKPRVVSPALAFAPAAVVLLLAVGAHVARRKLVR